MCACLYFVINHRRNNCPDSQLSECHEPRCCFSVACKKGFKLVFFKFFQETFPQNSIVYCVLLQAIENTVTVCMNYASRLDMSTVFCFPLFLIWCYILKWFFFLFKTEPHAINFEMQPSLSRVLFFFFMHDHWTHESLSHHSEKALLRSILMFGCLDTPLPLSLMKQLDSDWSESVGRVSRSAALTGKCL